MRTLSLSHALYGLGSAASIDVLREGETQGERPMGGGGRERPRGREGLVCLDVRPRRTTSRISRRVKGAPAGEEESKGGLVCLDVRAYWVRDSISRRAN